MTFLPSTAQWRAKKQDFCKKAQWRAKKLRERGSSTARPTEKGVGGLLIRSSRSIRSRRFVPIRSRRFVPIRSRFGRDSVAIRSRFGRFRRVDSVDFVAIWSAACVAIQPTLSRHPRRHSGDTQPTLSRHSADTRGDTQPTPKATLGRHSGDTKDKTQKKPDSSIGGSGSAIARRRALLTFR